MVATTMIHNIALIMLPHQHVSLYRIQPPSHFATAGSLIQSAALMLMHCLHAASSAHQMQPPLSVILHPWQHWLCLLYTSDAADE